MLTVLLIVTGCGSEESKTVTIAEQFGLAYAPLTLAKELDLITPHLPEGYSVEWAQMMNTAAIREAMLSGDLDIGFMGIPPFLIGYDHDMDWHIFRGLNRAPLGLTYRTDRIRTLDDLGGADRIALPQPGSIQHILLTMYLDRVYGDPGALDEILLTLSHPDGQMALLSETDVVAHFTSPPYIFEELADPRVELLVDSEEAFGGPFTFIVGVLRKGLDDPVLVDAVNAGIDEAIDMLEENPEEAAAILADIYGIEEETLRVYLEDEKMDFSDEILGVGTFISFMLENGYLENGISESEVLYER